MDVKVKDLPDKFTPDEQYAYKWLYDCQITGWMVDLKTKTVMHIDTLDGGTNTWANLVLFARSEGMVLPADKLNRKGQA